MDLKQAEKFLRTCGIDIYHLGLPGIGKNETITDKYYRDKWIENLNAKPIGINEDKIMFLITGKYTIRDKINHKEKYGKNAGMWMPGKPEYTEIKVIGKMNIKGLDYLNNL